MKIKPILSLTLLFAALPFFGARFAAAQADQLPFPDVLSKQLAARASNYTEVTLDRKMLDFASHFMDNENDAEGKRIIAKLRGIYVRTYEFDKPGEYTAADLEQIRAHFESGDWSPIVKSRSKNDTDDSDIYMKTVNGEIQGMFILNAEPKELDIVYIDGPIRPEDLEGISGNFGIPSNLGGAKTIAPPPPNPMLQNRKAGPQ
ncbi:MAG TPA: DUF4252 domain-containing protein [Acidobacteriaceae bacterium]|nr:DUF4252 domain-containing protein [Acidobacteriaceae bacterium]